MATGGKRSRPFITLAAYDAMLGGAGTRGGELAIPDPVKRAALAIEAFHKASLIHDDIEDGDAFRYGQETLHRRHGVGPAINIGDYLVGWGYRLLARDRQAVGAVVAADLLARFSDAHVKLAEGQGAELLWRQSADKALKPIDALRIYALKTAPAFEAALGAGIRLAGDHPELDKTVTEFGKNLGIAFQILNDLKDFEADSDNKIIAGQDVLASRPTVLLALALEALPPARREELLALVSGADAVDDERVSRVRYLYELAGVFEKAERLVDKFRAKAEDLADAATPPDLRDLLLYLVDSVLDGSSHVVPEAPAESSGGLVSLPVA
jgi:geranylgeranyl pyrophosphate synthase